MEIRRYKIDKNKEQFSRYKDLERIVYENGEEIIETPNEYKLPNNIHCNVHTVKSCERLDTIAYKYYKNPLYYWIIALASNIDDPLSVKEGDLLKIPDLYQFLQQIGG